MKKGFWFIYQLYWTAFSLYASDQRRERFHSITLHLQSLKALNAI